MAPLKLVIANKNISSWSMRPWVLLTEAGIPFEEVMVPFGAPDWKARVGSPSGRVPLLIDGSAGSQGDLRIWDSLAIAEHVNERFPEKQLWPAQADACSVARSASSEMHSGFPDLRRECSMNLVQHSERTLSARAQADVQRVDALFADCRQRFGSGGDLLFGKFSIADAMFAPVASRARTYGLKLSPISQRYVDALWELPSVQRWAKDARAEVDAGVVDPLSHGALFSRGEAEQFAKTWVDRLNGNQFDALAALCIEGVHLRGARAQSSRAEILERKAQPGRKPGALSLESCVWDGDVNRLVLFLADKSMGRAERWAETLSLDSSGLVAEIDTLDQ